MNPPNYSQSKLGESANKSEISYGSENKRRKYMEEGDYEQDDYNSKFYL